MPAAPQLDGPARPLRVLLVDDQPLFRMAAAALVESVPQFAIVGEAGSGEQAVEMADRLDPDLIVMDVRLPGIDGVEATRQIVTAAPRIRVLLVSTYELADLPDIAGSGAAGFRRKQDLDAASLRAAAGIG